MNILREKRSIVAVQPTRTGLTFVFFEGGRLLDWQSVQQRGEADELSALDRILDACAADVLVIEDPDARKSGRRPGPAARLRRMIAHARSRGLTVRRTDLRAARDAWRLRGVRNKQAVAIALAELIPELKRIVPPPRKNWMSEDERLDVFRGVTLVLHAFRA